MEEIKKCPFCGGEAKVRRDDMRRGEKEIVYVRCTSCHATGHKFVEDGDYDDYSDKAIEAWNRRV